MVGCAGVNGCASIVTLAEETDVQLPKVAVIVYVPAFAVTTPAIFVTIDG